MSRPKARKPLEREIQSEVLGACALLGVRIQVTDPGVVLRATKGRVHVHGLDADWPDLTGVIPTGPWKGRALLIEVKRPGASPRESQLAALSYLRASGAIVGWTTDGVETHGWLSAVLAGRSGSDQPGLERPVQGWR